MIWLLDTNILARAAQPGHSQHLPAVEAAAKLRIRGETIRIAPQSLYEFWVLATRPLEINGLGLSLQAARAELDRFQRFYVLLDETPAVFSEWLRLVSTVDIRGKTGHDARLVAVMNLNGINHILTFNVGDFHRYPGLSVFSPEQVLQSTF